MKTSGKKVTLIAAILSLYICGAGGTLENSAIQAMIEAWPNVSTTMIRMLTTLPSLTSMFVMLFVGRIVGKKLSFRTSVLFGLTLMAAGGLIPFFFHGNWIMILIFRALIGIGVGCASLGNPLIMRTIPAKDFARYIGFGGIVGSLSNVIINPVVGILTNVGWQYSFLANSIYLIPLVLCVLFLKEGTLSEDVQAEGTKAEKNPDVPVKKGLPAIVYLFIGLQFVSTTVLFPLLSGMSGYLTTIGITNSAIAGLMISVYTGGGIAGNLLLPTIRKVFGRHSLTFAYSLVVIGLLLVILVHHIVFITIGVFLAGTGFITLSAVYQVYNGLLCSKDQQASASTKVVAANQCGVFLSSFFITASGSLGLFQNEITNTLFVCLIIYIIMTVFYLLMEKRLVRTE